MLEERREGEGKKSRREKGEDRGKQNKTKNPKGRRGERCKRIGPFWVR